MQEKANNTTLTTNENVRAKTNQPKTKALPKTGDAGFGTLPLVSAGAMLSLTALVLFRKRKS